MVFSTGSRPTVCIAWLTAVWVRLTFSGHRLPVAPVAPSSKFRKKTWTSVTWAEWVEKMWICSRFQSKKNVYIYYRYLRHISPGCFNGIRTTESETVGCCEVASREPPALNPQLVQEAEICSWEKEDGLRTWESRDGCFTRTESKYLLAGARVPSTVMVIVRKGFCPGFIHFKANLLNLNSKAMFVIHKFI